jgi:hypothetical protein
MWTEGDTIIWEHTGFHDHIRPPQQGRLTETQRALIRSQVIRRMTATPHQLQTGDLLPGSIPLGLINPVLNDPRKARYAVEQARQNIGMTAVSYPKGSLGLMRAIRGLNEDIGEPFIVESQVHGPSYLLLQSSWMVQILFEGVNDWIEDGESSGSGSRHGFVTDSDHTFFHSGLLLVTVVFNRTQNAWCPVLMAFIDGQDVPHHWPFFRYLFRQIREHAGSRFNAELLVHVS